MVDLTVQPVKRLISSCGAKRVSNKAVHALIRSMDKKTVELLITALDLSRHSNRSTVMKKDIKTAKKLVFNGK